MNNSFVKSTIILSVATLLSKILGSIFRIPLQNIAGDEVLGIFSLVYPVYMVALTLSVAGIPIAISKLISEARAKQDEAEIRDIFRSASILALLFGVISFTIIYSFSGQIANVLGGEGTKLALIIVAMTLLVAPYMAVYRGFFQGFENMKPTAISQVLEQFIRVALILGAAYFLVRQQQSNEMVAGGVMVGSSIGALASLVYLRFLFVKSALRPVSVNKYTFRQFKQMTGTILKISLPICVGAITMALLNFVDSVTVPGSLKALGQSPGEINFLFGIYGRGLALVQIATVVATSIVLPLIPLITRALAKNEHAKAKDAIDRAHGLTHFVSWPAAFGLTVLTLPINLALFTDLQGSTVLAIISFSSLFTSLTVLGTGVLQGMNRSKLAAWIIVGGVAVKWVLNIVLIDLYGLTGAAISTAIIYFILFVTNTFFIWKIIRFSVWKRETIVFAGSALGMAAVIGVPLLYMDISSWSRIKALSYVAAALFVGAIVYGVLVIVFKGLDRNTLMSMPIIGKFYKSKPTNNEQAKNKANGKKDKERKVAMKKWLWIILSISLLLTIPSIITRSNVEWSNQTYEMIVPYEDIQDMLIDDGDLDLDSVLREFKLAGLNSVSLEPETLGRLQQGGVISLISSQKMKEYFILNRFNKELEQMPNRDGVYVYVDDSKNSMLNNNQNPELKDITRVVIQGNEYYFIPGKESYIKGIPLGYNPEIVQIIKSNGLHLVPRIPNMKLVEENQFLIDQLIALKDEQTEKVLYLGESVTGFGERNKMIEWTRSLHEKGYSALGIEFANQKGFASVANLLDFDIIRLHSINLKDKTHQINVDQVIRAVKERNIKAVFMRLPLGSPTSPPKEAGKVVEETTLFLQDVQNEMPSIFTNGVSENFSKINIPFWQKAMGLLAGIAFAGLAALGVTKNRFITYVILTGMSFAALLYLVTGMSILVKAFALAIALAGPIYAVIPKREIRNTKHILLEYGLASLIAVIAVWIIVVLLNGNQFLVNVELFKGVKLVYIVPIAFTVVYAVWGNIRTLMTMSIRYWHIGVIAFIAVAGLYYISRTGNEGSASSIELTARVMLEKIMYVRPRTKEFLIGFPFFVLALYVLKANHKAGLFLLIPGVIGFLSLVNTFTHLHIPLHVSLLRSIYSLVFGLIIGFIFIWLYKLAVKYYKMAKTRWLT